MMMTPRKRILTSLIFCALIVGLLFPFMRAHADGNPPVDSTATPTPTATSTPEPTPTLEYVDPPEPTATATVDAYPDNQSEAADTGFVEEEQPAQQQQSQSRFNTTGFLIGAIIISALVLGLIFIIFFMRKK